MFFMFINAEKEGISCHWNGQDLDQQCFRVVRVAAAFGVGGRQMN